MLDDELLICPVAIVGGGPVGLVLALFLDYYGVNSVIFNIDETTRWHPRGNTHNARTMEHYRRLGIARKIRQLGLPFDHPTDVAYFTRLNGWELARLPMPSEAEKMRLVVESPKVEQVPEPIHRANQMYVERFLLEHASTRPNITTRFGWRVEEFRQEGDEVWLSAENTAGGESRESRRESWRVQYMVGCDGNCGSVRHALGARYHGYDNLGQEFLGGSQLATYLRMPTLYRDFLGQRRAWQYWLVNSEFPRVRIVALNGNDEFLIHFKLTDPDRPPDFTELVRIVRRCAGAEIPIEILGAFPWTAGVALVSDRFGEGRVMLAGDAAHLFTPTGGFGMNTGIDDAANLSWKLAAMVKGWGGPALLDSYQIERKPIALRNTIAACELARNIGQLERPPAIEEDSPRGAAARAKLGAALTAPQEEFASIGVQLGARYDGSPLIAADGAASADNFVKYTPSSVPGGRAPHLWIDRGRGLGSSLFDHLGRGFTLLRLGTNRFDAGSIEEAARAVGVPLNVIDIDDADARDLYERDLILIRPDQHVAWRGNREPMDADKLIAQVTGTPPQIALRP